MKKAGVPNSEGEFAVVADIGYCRYSIPYPAEVSMLRFGPMGPGACGTGANMSGFGIYGEASGGGIMNGCIGARSMEKSTATGTERLRWRL